MDKPRDRLPMAAATARTRGTQLQRARGPLRSAVCITLAAVAISLCIHSTADAGLPGYWPLTIDVVNRVATGSPAQARAGLGNQYIGCWVAATGLDDNSGGSADARLMGGCAAVDQFNVPVSCAIPTAVATVSRDMLYLASRDALISFSWNPDGTCAVIQTSVFASMQPKRH